LQSSEIIRLPTRFGDLSVKVGEEVDSVPSWILLYKEPWEHIPFLRIHSSCLFSESFLSQDCDCSLQLTESLKTIVRTGGAIVYLYQEGRGVGLFRKATAIAKEQELGIDTASAFNHLGYDLDARDYSAVASALQSIDFPKVIRLATNNPRKVKALEEEGYVVAERAYMEINLTDRVRAYVRSKESGLGHYERD